MLFFIGFNIGYRANVQAMVEKPVPYILARCPSNSLQLCYGDVRLEDYIKINNELYEVTPEIKIQDEIRFFKGKNNKFSRPGVILFIELKPDLTLNVLMVSFTLKFEIPQPFSNLIRPVYNERKLI